MRNKKKLLTGAASLLVLGLLKGGDKYGWEILSMLEAASDKTFRMREGTLYPVLHRLEYRRLVSAYEGKNDRGRFCRFYHLTNKGSARLSKNQSIKNLKGEP